MPAKLGILAGRGELPRLIAANCRTAGRDFFVIGFRGQADPEEYSGMPFEAVRLGAAGKIIEVMRREGVQDVVMAGAVNRPSLASLRPDATALRFFMKTGAQALGDDGLLRALIDFLEQEYGFRVVGADSLLPESRFPPGPLGKCRADEQARRDIERGRRVLALIGAADVGQAVVVQDGIVLGVEAVEGTDALLARCGALRRAGPGGVLVKMRKPGQESRADMPTVGLQTLHGAAAAGLRGVAIDAGGTILLNRDEIIREADARSIFLEALPPLEARENAAD